MMLSRRAVRREEQSGLQRSRGREAAAVAVEERGAPHLKRAMSSMSAGLSGRVWRGDCQTCFASPASSVAKGRYLRAERAVSLQALLSCSPRARHGSASTRGDASARLSLARRTCASMRAESSTTESRSRVSTVAVSCEVCGEMACSETACGEASTWD